MSHRRKRRDFPHVPLELISRIMFFVLYDEGHFSPYMQAEDLSGHAQDSSNRQRRFSYMFLPVSREINRTALTHLWRSLTFTRAEELDHVLDTMVKGAGLHPDIDLGGLCGRIDMRITGDYNRSTLIQILERTPNVRIFVLGNSWAQSPNVSARAQLEDIVNGLTSYATQLKRIQLQAPGEDPTAAQTIHLLEALPKLVTIHVDRFADAWGGSDDTRTLQHICPQLETISIGNAKRQGTRPMLASTTDDILPSLYPKFLLPKLNTVYFQRFTPSIRQFLDTYADQIQELGFCATHAWVAGTWMDATGGHLVRSCPRLRNLVCVVVDTTLWPSVYNIPHQPSVQKIVIVYAARSSRNTTDAGDIFTDFALTLPKSFQGKEAVVLVPTDMAHIATTRWYRACRRRMRKEGMTMRTNPQ